MTAPSEQLQALHQQTLALLTHLHRLAAQAPDELQSTWAEHLGRLQELVQFLAGGASTPLVLPTEHAASKAQWVAFGRLLRDKRTAAGLSRVQLARRANLSDATLRFAETARYPPQPRHFDSPHRRHGTQAPLGRCTGASPAARR